MSRPPRPTAMRAAAIALLSLAFLGAGLSGPADAERLKVGDRLKELDVAVDGRGKAFKLKAYRGKWVLVTVGASWCKPCKKELPVWDRIAGELKGKITFVAINIDNDVAVGKKFNTALKLKNMTLVYMPEEASSIDEAYGGDTMPSSFVADPQGVIKLARAAFQDRDPDGEYRKLKAELTKLLP